MILDALVTGSLSPAPGNCELGSASQRPASSNGYYYTLPVTNNQKPASRNPQPLFIDPIPF